MTKQEAIELLSEMRSRYNCFDESERQFYEALSVAIKELSSKLEIIRCEDCYHYPSEYADCPMIGWARNENDFCSKAERKYDD